MGIPRKPDTKTAISVEDFIKKEPSQSEEYLSQDTGGRRIISLSLMPADVSWINQILVEINKNTKRKITRSELICVALGILREKNLGDIMQLIKAR